MRTTLAQLKTGIAQPQLEAIPAELRALPRWVTHLDKVPHYPTAKHRKASSTNPATWGNFDDAVKAYQAGGRDGVGFVLNGDGIVCIDLDKCVIDGEPDPKAMALLDRIGCQYVELSPSGTGLHGWGRGPYIRGCRGQLAGLNIELYATKRFMTMTGQTLKSGPLVELQGFQEVASELRERNRNPAADRRGQKSTEDGICPPLSSSVNFPEFVIPDGPGARNDCLFGLARLLKGQMSEATRDELRPIVKEWHKRALPAIGTKDFATTWSDFLHAWDNVKHPYGETLEQALSTIDHSEPVPEYVQRLGFDDQAHSLYRICKALHEYNAPEPFFISARKAGEKLGINHTDAAKMLKAFVREGVLELVTKGIGNKASRYRCTDVTLLEHIDAAVAEEVI